MGGGGGKLITNICVKRKARKRKQGKNGEVLVAVTVVSCHAQSHGLCPAAFLAHWKLFFKSRSEASPT